MTQAFLCRCSVVLWSLPLLLAVSQERLIGQSPKSTTAGQANDPKELFVESVAKLLERGHFIVSGEVIDEQGRPLPKVRLTFPKNRSLEDIDRYYLIQEERRRALTKEESDRLLNSLPDVFLEPDESKSVDGKFSLDVKNVRLFSLAIFKEGYYDEFIGFSPAEEADKVVDANVLLLRAGKIPPEVLVQRMVKVVLEKKGVLTKLERRVADLESLPKGGKRILQLGPTNDPANTKLITVGPATKEVSARSLVMESDRQADGTIVTEMVAGASVPKVARLKFSSPDSGFVQYQRNSKKPIGRVMKAAPAAGYVSELVYTSKDLRGSLSEATNPLFYFKVGSTFGRGSYAGFLLSDDRLTLTLRLILEIQADGTRNLETEN